MIRTPITMVQRVFFNVGQALFVMESRGNRTIVYDCGGKTIDVVRAAITQSGLDGQSVDALFISHYDTDHINGVYYLLKRCTVKHLFLPMVREEDKLLLLLEHPSRARVYELTSDIQGVLQELGTSNQTKVHYVQPEEIPYQKEADPNRIISQSPSPVAACSIEQLGDMVDTGTPIRFADEDWVYIPYNLKYMSTYQWERFLSGLNLPDTATTQDLLENWPFSKRKLKDELIRCGAVTKKDINTHSMTLYSGPAQPSALKQGCLYTGDFDTKINYDYLSTRYAAVWGNIGCVQVPHHGSKNNWDFRLIVPGAKHIISAESKNNGKRNYVDPTKVIQDITNAGETCYVTDSVGSQLGKLIIQ